MHKGHKKIISTLVNSGFFPVIFSFNFSHETPISKSDFFYLMDPKKKIEIMEKLGVKLVISPYFEDVKNLSFMDFFKNILIDRLNAKLIVCGVNFKFGRNKLGDVFSLKRLEKRYGVTVKAIDLVKFKDLYISSSNARKALFDCNFKLLKNILGYAYYIQFKISKTKNLGKEIVIYGSVLKKYARLKLGKYLVFINLLGTNCFGAALVSDFKDHITFKIKTICDIDKIHINYKKAKIIFIKYLDKN